jgi:transposase-like protein
MDGTPKTLLEAITYFADPARAHAYAVKYRWPNGIACPRHGCGSADVQVLYSRNMWRCKECKRDFSVKVGTIFEHSPIPLTKWLPAIWLLTNTKNGTSSCELARDLGVTQKTAWFMFHRIREGMRGKTYARLGPRVEVDETYVGGRKRVSHPLAALGRKHLGPRAGKTIVLGLVERSERNRAGNVRAMVVPNVTRATLHGAISEHVERGSTVYTDSWPAYTGLLDYMHYVINHDEDYVRGHIHTNTIENFWSLLKRSLKGTYICARPFHLSRYVDEQAFRFNTRDVKDGIRFAMALKRTDDTRLTYKTLTSANPRAGTMARPKIHKPRRRHVTDAPITGKSDRT